MPSEPPLRTLPFRAVLALPGQLETADGPWAPGLAPGALARPDPSAPTVPFSAVLPVPRPGAPPDPGAWRELELLEVRARHAGATVHEGRHPDAGRCEVTLLTAEGAAAVGRTFLLEARLETLVRPTPHAPRVVALGAAPRPWVARAWVEGPTLAARIAEGPLDGPSAARAGRAAALALAAAHEVRLVHGDLRLEDVRLPDEGPAVLCGFGRHTAVDPLSRRRPFGCGPTLAGGAVAPERSGGRPPAAAGDVFALGAVLLQALEGRRAGEGVFAVRRLAERCLAATPEARPTASEVAAALEPWSRPSRQELSGAALALLAAGALLAGALAAWLL